MYIILEKLTSFLFLLNLYREREREKHRFVVSLTYALTGCFLYVS